jgi:hypothetical protein
LWLLLLLVVAGVVLGGVVDLTAVIASHGFQV